MTPRIDVVIVTHNSGDVLGDCLAGLAEPSGCSITIVDSGSRSTSYLRTVLPGSPRVLEEPNVGYGTAANIGFAGNTAEWLALLNPDVRVSLIQLGQLVQDAGRWGIDVIAPALQDEHGVVQEYPYRAMTPYWRRPWRWRPLASHGPCRETEVLNGSILVLRRSAFERVGGFDPDFFLYAEEDDLVSRLRAAGAVVARDPLVEAVHLGESGSGAVPLEWRAAQRVRGRFQYLARHYSWVEAVLAVVLDLPGLLRRYGPAGTRRVLAAARRDARDGTPASERRRQIPAAQ